MTQVNNVSGASTKHVADIRTFVTRFASSACSLSTPHLYISALPLCPESSWVYAHYARRTQGVMCMKGFAMGTARHAVLLKLDADSVVLSIAYSPDGTRIASGSHDHTIRVWDAHTGAIVAGPFQGHTDWVTSVAFSPDGTRIVSGSDDRTIRVWDAHTGAIVASPFQGHTHSVRSVAFSPDGTRIVSGSGDHTIRVWDAHTGAIVAGPFQGHTHSVTSVALSPDGTRIVSGSHDRTIRVWGLDRQPGSDGALASPWIFNNNGWISTDTAVLFWVPPGFHSTFPRHANKLVMGPEATFQVDWSRLFLGDNWAQCYVSNQHPRISA
jgi:WD40 repeat protein